MIVPRYWWRIKRYPKDRLNRETYLLQTTWACNTVTEFVSCACRRVAICQKGKDAIDSVQLIRGFRCWVRRSIVNGLHGANAWSSCNCLVAELVQLIDTVAKSVVICHIVEELLSIQSSSEKQRQVPVCRFDNKCNFVLYIHNDEKPNVKVQSKA